MLWVKTLLWQKIPSYYGHISMSICDCYVPIDTEMAATINILIQAINDNSDSLNKNMDEMMDLIQYVGFISR